MALILNDHPLAFAANESLPLMDVCSFVEAFGYDIDRLYIDRFWDSIQDKRWVVVDVEMLKWMGYDSARDTDKKKKYLKMLKSNFVEGTDFDTISEDDSRVGALKVPDKDSVIVSPRAFRKTLMKLRTERADQICDYYLMLEDIMRDYMSYTRFVGEHNSAVEIRRLTEEAEPAFDLDTSPMRLHEYCYVMTSRRYFRRCMFKVGKSVNPKSRLVSHNCTQATDEDEMFYTHVIETFDCGGLEKLLHRALGRYHTKKEWFTVPHAQLKSIIGLVASQQAALLIQINSALHADPSEALSLEEFVDASPAGSDPKPTPCEAPVAVAVDAQSCQLCGTDMMIDPQGGQLACPICRDVSDATLSLFRRDACPSFKSKHATLSAMLSDDQYCSWLLSQRWFARRPEYELVRRLYAPLCRN